jgi:phosphorylase/glycogen(starch) synthase
MICVNQFENAKIIANWKQKITREWSNIKIISIDVYDSANKAFPLGSEINPKIVIDIGELSTDDIGIEVLFIEKRKEKNEFNKIIFKNELSIIETKGKQITYSCKIPFTQSGVYEEGVRIYPKNVLLSSRLDFPILKWV